MIEQDASMCYNNEFAPHSFADLFKIKFLPRDNQRYSNIREQEIRLPLFEEGNVSFIKLDFECWKDLCL